MRHRKNAGALIGAVLGLAAWLAYRPTVESNSHHVIGVFQLPWAVIAAAMALAVLATFFAASRPARSITRVPIVTALSGRPAPPKQVHRSAVPGIVLLVAGAVLFWYAGKQQGGGGLPEVVFGFVVLVAAVILLSPLFLATLARAERRAPIAVRLALRDLARYRARSGSALAAISLGVLVAVLVCVLSAQRYTVITEHAVHEFGLQASTSGWLIQTPHPPTGAQISSARLTAAAAGLSIETKSSAPSSAEILNWATAFGVALALSILAMTVGLIRSETASDLRTLTATGASGATRRSLTAATAGALALLAAVLGTVTAYVAAIAYSWDSRLDGLSNSRACPPRTC